MKRHHDRRFPGESDAYRDARDRLLDAEMDLRKRVEAVAALRRVVSPLAAKEPPTEPPDTVSELFHTRNRFPMLPPDIAIM